MGFLESLTGTDQGNQGKWAQKDAEKANYKFMQQTPEAVAAAAGAAGQGLGQQMGEQMGRTAATQGTQAATQAARTSGVNKGQAALLGGQQAGQAFTQGQQSGELIGTQLGSSNYNQAAGRQLQSIGQEAGIGTGQQAAGRQTGQDLMGGISKAAGFLGLGDGGIVTEPTQAVVGEKGPEAVIPLNDMNKVKEILKTVYASRKKGKKNAKN